TDDPRVQQLLDQFLDSQATPEEVCASCPELLPVVRNRWRRMRRVLADLDALFPPSGEPPPPPGSVPAPPATRCGAAWGRAASAPSTSARIPSSTAPWPSRCCAPEPARRSGEGTPTDRAGDQLPAQGRVTVARAVGERRGDRPPDDGPGAA